MQRNVRLKVEYDGTNYSGWQKQKDKNIKTIQSSIEKAIEKATKEEIKLIGSSRTDAGVHALAYTANFKTCSTIPGEKFKHALNRFLPEDIVILESEEVPMEFHSRFDCIGKTYVYKILNRPLFSPIQRNYIYHVKDELDINSMIEASKFLIGTHDFNAFKKSGGNLKTTVRTVTNINILKNNDIVEIHVSGDGFLYNMVRIISGTLIEVGLSRRKPEDISIILQSKDRCKAGMCAPARGLYLKELFYN
ncbi:tRNA pseudouridine(38-40) synthase TruA [Clostridium tetani]|uniref:tRNA pseudouridine(38-40) synthase TruA n=1 Tax=Clostridium tetani TaxID=1513 RepID=UPI00100A5B98|nr:tRNA pseudouridine(38-40) synthase TruA [Clostridium tetani]RXI39813.1 tRNA pseudouridine(38-40) synthase TruA [Clostridium tetani]